MTAEQFMKLYLGNIELRQYIVDTAKRRSRRVETCEDFVQEAWMMISISPYGHETEEYIDIADKAIESARYLERKESWAVDAYYFNLGLYLSN